MGAAAAVEHIGTSLPFGKRLPSQLYAGPLEAARNICGKANLFQLQLPPMSGDRHDL